MVQPTNYSYPFKRCVSKKKRTTPTTSSNKSQGFGGEISQAMVRRCEKFLAQQKTKKPRVCWIYPPPPPKTHTETVAIKVVFFEIPYYKNVMIPVVGTPTAPGRSRPKDKVTSTAVWFSKILGWLLKLVELFFYMLPTRCKFKFDIISYTDHVRYIYLHLPEKTNYM